MSDSEFLREADTVNEEESKSLKWQRGKLSKGLCSICGKRRLRSYTQRCDPCQARHREQKRARRGGKPWEKCGIGRPLKGRGPKWEKADWSLPVTEIARALKVSPSAVYQYRARMGVRG